MFSDVIAPTLPPAGTLVFMDDNVAATLFWVNAVSSPPQQCGQNSERSDDHKPDDNGYRHGRRGHKRDTSHRQTQDRDDDGSARENY